MYVKKKNKNYEIIIGENKLQLGFSGLVVYWLNMICLNIQFPYKIVYK